MGRKNAGNLPRKRPLQARSRATVEALLEAAAQILAARGYERSTTDAVAERAGVSIGTLYQYFQNKESLVAALIRHHIDEIVVTVGAALSIRPDVSIEDLLLALIRAGLAAHRVNPALHKVLAEEVPRAAYPIEARDLSGRLQAMIEAALQHKAPGIPAPRRRLVACIIECTIEALTHRAVVEAPDWLESGLIEEETLALLCPYVVQALDAEAVQWRGNAARV